MGSDILYAFSEIMNEGRSLIAWQKKNIEPEILRKLYNLVKMGPTSVNSCPARFVFLTSPQAREKLIPALAEGNRPKTQTAPVTVIIAYDTQFYDYVPELFPHRPEVADGFKNSATSAEETAFRNSSLQGAYLILAARALGLDCGPMSGFDPAKVNESFFADGRWKVNFLVNLGYGDRSELFSRLPRLPFETACRVE